MVAIGPLRSFQKVSIRAGTTIVAVLGWDLDRKRNYCVLPLRSPNRRTLLDLFTGQDWAQLTLLGRPPAQCPAQTDVFLIQSFFRH